MKLPGPMQFIDNYVESMKNPSKVQYPHPLYENASKETFGILVYQEQIMQVVQDMAGFTLGEADILRRGIGKKEVAYINQMEIEFAKGCTQKGIPEKISKEVYAMIKKFAEYGFNKSHSACYGYLAYETAYLKAHYPECFMAANCTINADNKDKLISCLAEIKNMGIKLLPPLLPSSRAKFSIEEYEGHLAIRYGFNGIEGIGVDAANHIEEIKDSPTLYNFIDRYPEIRSNQLSFLVNGGTFDMWGSRKEMIQIAPDIKETVKLHHKISNIYQHSILDELCGEDEYTGIEFGFKQKIAQEKQAIHCCLLGHPLDSVRSIVKGYETKINDLYSIADQTDVQILCQITNVQTITTKKGDMMAFITIEDEYDSIEAIVFPKNYEAMSHLLKEDNILILTGKVQIKEEGEENTVNVIVNALKFALSTELRFYLQLSDLKRIEKELLKNNGIVEVVAVNPKTKTYEKQEYNVDYMSALAIFNKYHIKFVI